MFGTVQNPIRMMEIEHQEAGDGLAAIRRAERRLRAAGRCMRHLPPGARGARTRSSATCTTHVHLENNVLFPKAVELEEKVEHHGARAEIPANGNGRDR